METIFNFLSGVDYAKIWDWIHNHTDLGILTIIIFILIFIVKDKISVSLQGKKYEALLNKGLELISERVKENIKNKEKNEEEKAKLDQAWNDLNSTNKPKEDTENKEVTTEENTEVNTEAPTEVKEEVKDPNKE